jgi:hypothetical protein
MVFLFSIIGWFIVDLVLEVVGEGVLELTRVLNEEEAARLSLSHGLASWGSDSALHLLWSQANVSFNRVRS